MTVWRPPARVVVKVIGLVYRERSLLAMEVPEDSGALKGVRPPGGTVEFGETREETLIREFREELETEVEILGEWHLFENIYEHHGEIGHEYVFACPIRLCAPRIYQADTVAVTDGGVDLTLRWFPIEGLKSGATTLYPQGLIDLLP